MPLFAALLLACAAPDGDGPARWPAPDAWGPTTGPGGPARTFTDAERFQACAYLTGGPEDIDHHNSAVMVDGYLLMPWAPEDGGGGLTFFDVSDPCAPVKIGEAYSPVMRESHTVGLSLRPEGRYAAVDYLADRDVGGVGIWDITDPTQPTWLSAVALPGHTYPDSYTRLTLSVTWVGRYIYAATTSLGVFVIDAADPSNPTVVEQVRFDGPHIVGSFHAWGNTAMAASAGVSRTVMMDLSDPVRPVPLAGGDFQTRSADGAITPYYFSNIGQRWGLFARSMESGGPMVYDLTDPAAPVLVAEVPTPTGDGGYIYQHGDHLFVGDSNFGTVYDFADPTAPADVGTFLLKGDLDTVTPLGNVALVAVDEKADPDQATAVMPWATQPDADPPRPGLTSPADGARFQAVTSRVAVVFDEMIEPMSAFAGSFRLMDERGRPVAATFSVHENIVTLVPDAPLRPDTWYLARLPAGGLADVSGNAIADELTWTFQTAGAP